MKEKIKNIWKRACAFFAQADKQKHFTVGALACALVTIAVVLCCGKLYIDHDGEVRIPGALRVGQLIQSVAADEPTGEHTME